MSNLKHSLLQLLITLLFVVAFAVLCTCAVTAQTRAFGWRMPSPGWVQESNIETADGEIVLLYNLGDYSAYFTSTDFAGRPDDARVMFANTKASKLNVARNVVGNLFILDGGTKSSPYLPYTKSTVNGRLIYRFVVVDFDFFNAAGEAVVYRVYADVDVDDARQLTETDTRTARVTLVSNNKELGVYPMDVPCPD